MGLGISVEEKRKFCEYCNKETTWKVIHKDKGLMIIECKECFKVEQVYSVNEGTKDIPFG